MRVANADRPPPLLAVLTVGGSVAGGLLILSTTFLPAATGTSRWLGDISVRPRGMDEIGVAVVLGAVAILLPALALGRRNPLWMIGTVFPGMAALCVSVWFLTVRIPELTRLASTVEIGLGWITGTAGAILLVSSGLAAVFLTRSVRLAMTPLASTHSRDRV